jgi:hypothetical protein
VSGILPKFVTPDDVRDIKNRLDPFVRALDATVSSCKSITDGTRNAWQNFSKAWRGFYDEEDSWMHAAAQYDNAESYERSIAEWQRIIGAACPVPGPKVDPPTAPSVVTKDLQETIRTVAIAGGIIVALITLRSVVK